MKLDIKGISFSYDSVKALDNITFEVNEGEILGVTGPNGSGKTTLLRCINRVLKPKIGTIFLDKEDILELDRKEIAKNIGVVPQNATIHFPFTVFDIVLMGRTPHLGRLDRETSKDLEVAKNAMRITNTQHLADRLIDEVSGGEKQRIIIARALTQEPKILLLDEPTLHLDINHQLEVLELIKRLARKNRLIVVLVSHDLNLANRYCDRLMLINSSKIHAIGKPQEVLTRENIEDVYNIEVEYNYNKRSKSFNIIPISTIDSKL
ncbi:MAG: ABC transporter ATP-binding protein [Methanocellales archaeon]|nr:ABC transporter ATP-binding protein [Methanocellales archaeon]MDD3292026.1 ABC transporter ATP-binding protein [Methanocellales archaeon]MDD5235691.1 ABC transporter ATP-binding protein [Methanocellales archaeon]MDD5485617.1 ABC transporter ATP-binding protein [Methanocellales archaeon]